MMRRSTVLACAVPVAAAALLASGCGGGKSPGVASLGSGTTAATTTTSAPQVGSGGGGLRPPAGAHFSIGMYVGNAADGAKFSACMRKHGVTSFPDPNGQGVIQIHSGTGIDPGSPVFQSARSACSKLLPNGGQPTPAEQAQRQKEMLAYSECMRAHGLKDFPDPSSGGLRIQVRPGSDLDPGNAQFQAAQKACRGHLPFKGAAIGAKG